MAALEDDFRVKRIGALPPHSWLLRWGKKQSQLYCGDFVDVRFDRFFEGAWSGPYEAFDFDERVNVFGSGATRGPQGWLLVPPSHTLEPVFALQVTEGGWTASNSLPFLKQDTGFSFEKSDTEIKKAFVGILRGISFSPAQLRTSRGTLFIVVHHNARLTPNGLEALPKASPPHFDDYAGYLEYLTAEVSAVTSNASAGDRRARFSPVCTLTRGYDSTACAVLAKKVGCTEGLTFVNARGGHVDDGTETGERLGMSVARLERSDIMGVDADFVAEMYATGMQAVEIACEPLQGSLKGKLLLTGHFGGVIWSMSKRTSIDLRDLDLSGSSLAEFRMRESFVHVPVPFIGALRHPEVNRISLSEEMKPYSIGGWYDRPIPRRIAEEASVPRSSFGQGKFAIMSDIFHRPELLSEPVRTEIMQTLSAASILQMFMYRVKVMWFDAQWAAHQLCEKIARLIPRALEPLFRRVASKILLFGRSWWEFEHSHPFNAIAFEWALRRIQPRYEMAMKQDDSEWI